MENNTKIIYDKTRDTLYFSKGKSYASVDIDDFILDFDKRGFLTGIEIDNASNNLGTTKSILKNIKTITLNATYKPNLIKILLFVNFEKSEKVINIPLFVSLGHKATIFKKTEFAVA